MMQSIHRLAYRAVTSVTAFSFGAMRMEKNKGGRPTKYEEDFARQAESLCKMGATNAELADFFKVSIRTIERWSSQNEAFCRALKAGKAEADNRVERSLYERAVGYSYDSEIVKINADGAVHRAETREHVPPDTTAAIFWLKNRDPKNWRDKRETDLNHGVKDEIGEFFSRIDSASKGLDGLRGEIQRPKVETE